MKPLKIELKNVGPYIDEEIDFENLDNLFLITGPTGSGKTFIFDAMTFALYGDVKGNRDGLTKSLKSTFAEAEEEGGVTFTFLLDGDKYKVSRSLPYDHITSGGKVNPKGNIPEVWKFNHKSKSFVPMFEGENPSVITKKIEELIGLKADEFSMIVVLPQGAFAEFLKQKSSDRTVTLSKLFPVDLYKTMMETVKTKATDLTSKINSVAQALEVLLQDVTVDEAKSRILENDKLIKKLSTELEKVDSQIQKAASETATLNEERKAAVEFKNNTDKKAELESEKNLIEADRKKLQNARNALQMTAPYLRKQKATENLSRIENELVKLAPKYEASAKRLSELEEKKSDIEKMKDEIASRKNLLEKVQKAGSLQSEIKSLEKLLENGTSELSNNKTLFEQNKKMLDELKAQKKESEKLQLASTLVLELKENEPCPVCGSVHHPNPAEKNYTALDLDTKISVQEKNVENVEKAIRAGEKNVSGFQATLKAKQDEFEGLNVKLPLPDVSEISQKIHADEKTVMDFETDYLETQKNVSSLKGSVESLNAEKESALLKKDEAEKEFTVELKKSVFKSEMEIEMNLLPESEVNKLESKINAWEKDYATVSALLEKSSSKRSVKEIDSELDKKNELLADLKNSKQKNQSEYDVLSGENKILNQKISEAERLESERVHLETVAAPLKKLDADLNGKNPKKLNFDSWALGVYFEEVLNQASRRFSEISNGRYFFKIKDEISGNGKKGLDFVVCDTYNGVERDVKTLSGGETFMASISLALAVTDIVQAKSGGIQLDSLFIDEGFGTLDVETQDVAIEILKRLGETKTIGIISHVDNLKRTIRSQVVINKTSSGSHVKIV